MIALPPTSGAGDSTMATTETVVRNPEYSSLTYRRPAAMPGHHVTR
jgi:hypothetical protein